MSQITMPKPDTSIIARQDKIVADLEALIGPNAIISDPIETIAYECDALTAYRCPPLAVALPSSTQEVADLLKYCHQNNIPVIPRGRWYLSSRWRFTHRRCNCHLVWLGSIRCWKLIYPIDI